MEIQVRKRNGLRTPLNLDKIHAVVAEAVKDIEGVSHSEIELKSRLHFHDDISTEQIQETIIRTAAGLISQERPNYQYVAARLKMFDLRKRVYGQFEPIHLMTQITKHTDTGVYDKEILEIYTEDEINILNDYLDHKRDFNFAYSALEQLEGKYLAQNRVKHIIYETPQMLYMLIAMCLFGYYSKDTRLDYVKRFYDATSLFKLSLPTPIMAGVRTPTRQFSSCVKIESGDSLESINATASAIVKYVSQRAGIGINAGRIRALGSPIRGGEAFHTGCIPFYKHFQTAVKSCSQGGVRGGAATIFYPMWHLEVESLLVLKNNRGVEENRVRHLDYGVQLNKTLYQRLIKGLNITLFSPNEVPGLYDAFFEDQEKFERLYLRYENDPDIRKKTIPASTLFGMLAAERAGTGRIYIHNVDHTNEHSPFDPSVAPIRQSNLCLEIALPTKPINDINDPDGEIALCTLSAFNLGALDSLDELENLADLIVRALDSLLDYQNYPVKAAEISSKRRRSLGLGVTNLAYYFAKNGVKYSDGSANALTHQTFEAIQYYLLKASNNLAKEVGPCEAFHETRYAQGIMPTDTYRKDVDKFCNEPLHYDWPALTADIQKFGLRNSTLTAQMPCETSSQITNSTNGIEPALSPVTTKSNKGVPAKQVVPEYNRLKNMYEFRWNITNNQGYLQIVAIIQKFFDQSISANTNYDPENYPGAKVPVKIILQDILKAYSYGLKTLYYHNTRDHSGEEVIEDACDGACKL